MVTMNSTMTAVGRMNPASEDELSWEVWTRMSIICSELEDVRGSGEISDYELGSAITVETLTDAGSRLPLGTVVVTTTVSLFGHLLSSLHSLLGSPYQVMK